MLPKSAIPARGMVSDTEHAPTPVRSCREQSAAWDSAHGCVCTQGGGSLAGTQHFGLPVQNTKAGVCVCAAGMS